MMTFTAWSPPTFSLPPLHSGTQNPPSQGENKETPKHKYLLHKPPSPPHLPTWTMVLLTNLAAGRLFRASQQSPFFLNLPWFRAVIPGYSQVPKGYHLRSRKCGWVRSSTSHVSHRAMQAGSTKLRTPCRSSGFIASFFLTTTLFTCTPGLHPQGLDSWSASVRGPSSCVLGSLPTVALPRGSVLQVLAWMPDASILAISSALLLWVKWKSLSHVWLSVTPWTIQSLEFSTPAGVGSLSLLQGIFPTQGLNPGLLHCRQILYQLRHKGSPRILEWVSYPFSSGSCWPRNWTVRGSTLTETAHPGQAP